MRWAWLGGWLCGGLVDELMSWLADDLLVKSWFNVCAWLVGWLAGWAELDNTMMTP